MAWQQQSGGYPYSQQAVPPPAYFPGAAPAGGYPGGPGGYPGGPGGYPGGPGGYPGGPPQMPGFKPFPQATPYAATGGESGFGTTYGGYGAGDASGGNLTFSDKTIRAGFIRKVYSILMCQLVISAAFIALFVYNDSMRLMAKRSPGLMLVAFVVTIVCLLAMSCCESARRTAPTNYVFLFIFTVAESFMLGVFSSFFNANEVLLAVAICAVICFGLTVYAFQTKVDFTVMGGILFAAVLVLFVFSIVLMFWKSDTARLVYSCIGALIFSVYLIYDTQMMMGGDHKYSISPEEYVFAALNLYIDIVQIFIYILSIIGSSRD